MTYETAIRRVPNIIEALRGNIKARRGLRNDKWVGDRGMTKLDYNTSAIRENINNLRACYNVLKEIPRYPNVKVEDVNLIATKGEERIWSLFANNFGEVNSYLLTFEEAKNMIFPAVEDDGFDENELTIYAAAR